MKATSLAALLLLASHAQAQILYEPFNYTIPPNITLDGNGGWSANGSMHLVSGNLSLPAGMPAPLGNSAQATQSAIASLGFAAINSGSIFFSYAFRLDSIGVYPSIVRIKDTFALTDADGTLLMPRVQVMPTSVNTYQIVMAKRAVTVATNQATFNAGDTLFIVGRYTFNPGDSDDMCSLWINPNPATLGGSTPPAADIQDVGAGIFDSASLSGVRLSCLTQLGPFTLDELRIGTSWQQVTPVPEPLTLELLVQAGSAAFLLRRWLPRTRRTSGKPEPLRVAP